MNTLTRLLRFYSAAVMLSLLASCGGGGGGGNDTTASRGTAVQPRAAFLPQSGVWWNPQESGRGFTFELQGNQLFMASYLYEPQGPATWFVGGLTLQANGSFAGSLNTYAGGQTLLGSYRAPTGSALVAQATMTFSSPTSASLLVRPADGSAARTIPIERYFFSSAPSAATFENGIWWNANESGRAFLIDVQGSVATMATYMFETSGAPVWYIMNGPVQGGNSFGGNLQQYSNGQSLTGDYRPPVARADSPGRLTFTATSRNTANVTLPDGKVVPLTRYVFNDAPQVPVDPVPIGASASAQAGKALYANLCMSCHGEAASNISRVLTGADNPGNILAAISFRVGAMGFLNGVVSNEDAANLAAFLAQPGI